VCLIGIAWKTNADFLFQLAANRDEFFNRDTAAAGWWLDDPRVFGGRDLAAGGSWMGISRDGRFAAVTNVRQWPPPRAARSRGELVAAWLQGDRSQTAWSLAEAAWRDGDQFGGFHLLLGTLWNTQSAAQSHSTAQRDPARGGSKAESEPELVWTCNRPGGEPRLVEPGFHAWSNGGPDHDWPKTERLRSALDDRASAPSRARLLAVLADGTVAPDALLPKTGIGLDRERALSPIFVRAAPGPSGALYGTRASTVLRVDSAGGADWIERTHEPNGATSDVQTSFRFA